MSKSYDNWERLVTAVLRVERDKQIAMMCSEESSSIISSSSSFTSTSLIDDHHQSVIHQERSELPMDYSDLPPMDHRQWRTMLPPDEQEVVLRSASMRFFLDQMNGKNCFLFGATNVVALAPSLFWEMKAHPKSRFSEVGELANNISWGFTIVGVIKTQMLTPETLYAAYLVFGLAEIYSGLESTHSMIKLLYDDCYPKTQSQILDLQPAGDSRNTRGDGWMEKELGDFYVRDESYKGRIEVRLWGETNGFLKFGLIVEGIEIRPKAKTIVHEKKITRGKESLLSKLWISG